MSLQPQSLGRRAEKRVAEVLRGYGRKVAMMPANSPFDLLVDGHIKIEIKAARPSGKTKRWYCNLHRHGELNEANVDAYILRLEGVPYSSAAIHMLMKAPLGVKGVQVTFRGLLNGAGKHIEAFYRFARGRELR